MTRRARIIESFPFYKLDRAITASTKEMKAAGLVKSPRHGYLAITAKGRGGVQAGSITNGKKPGRHPKAKSTNGRRKSGRPPKAPAETTTSVKLHTQVPPANLCTEFRQNI